jgi:hypothetical protein
MSTTRRLRAQRGHRLSKIPQCRWCGNPIKISSRRPREFCGDRCRQTAHRRGLRDGVKVKGPNTRGQFRDGAKSTDPRTLDTPIRHLLAAGAHWKGPGLDRATIAKIVRSELGDGISEATSADGVQSTVIKAGRAGIVPNTNNFTNTSRPWPTAAAGTGDVISVAASDLGHEEGKEGPC